MRLLLCCLLFPLSLIGQDTFILGDGRASFDAAISPTWDMYTGENILWRVELPDHGLRAKSRACEGNAAGCIVVDDDVLLTVEPDRLVCLDHATGTLRWQRIVPIYDGVAEADLPAASAALTAVLLGHGKEDLEARKAALAATGCAKAPADCGYRVGRVSTVPACDGERIYLRNPAGTIFAFDRQGTPLWQQAAVGFHHPNQLVVADGWVYCGDKGGRLTALDGATGKVLWKNQGGLGSKAKRKYAVGYASPGLGQVGELAIIVSPAGSILRRDDGTVLTQTANCASTSAPIIEGDILLMANKPSKKGKSILQAFKLAVTEGGLTATAIYQTPLFKGAPAAPIVTDDGRVIVYDTDKGLTTACTLATGEVLWSEQPFARLRSHSHYARPGMVKVGKTLLAIGNLGMAATGTLADDPATAPTADFTSNMVDAIHGPPFASGQDLFIRSRRYLYKIGAKPAPAFTRPALDDARPRILCLGDDNASRWSLSPGWMNLLDADHPEWFVHGIHKGSWDLAGLAADLPAVLTAFDRVDAVVVMGSTNTTRLGDLEKRPIAERATDLAAVFDQLAHHPVTAKAAHIFVTAPPIFSSRLDSWMQKAYGPDADANSQAMATALQEAAQAKGATVFDLQGWGRSLKNLQDWSATDGEAGVLMAGGPGCRLADPGQAVVARWLGEQLQSIPALAKAPAPTARPPHKDGLAGVPLEVAGPGRFTLKPEHLQGTHLNLLVTADPAHPDATVATIQRKFNPHKLNLVVERAGWRANHSIAATEIIAIGTNGPVDPRQHSANAHGMKYHYVLKDHQCQVLVRFPIFQLRGQTMIGGTVAIGSGYTQQDKIMQAACLQGDDQLWHPLTATWVSRDGKHGWIKKD